MSNIIVSTCHDPYYNLAFEDYLYRQPLTGPKLFLWQNKPTVVIGRAQNPWRECNLELMQQDGIALARRQSGGGAVYHDLGNLNITLFMPIKHFAKNNNLAIITEALKRFNIKALANKRHAIDVFTDRSLKKISGSAFRQSKDKAFHHLTLLVDTNLTRLNQYLQTNQSIVGKGVTSVPSEVINLQALNQAITIDHLTSALIDQFCHQFSLEPTSQSVDQSAMANINALLPTYKTYTSFEWQYAKTLPFSEKKSFSHQGELINITCHIEQGRLMDVDNEGAQNLDEHFNAFKGKPYHDLQL